MSQVELHILRAGQAERRLLLHPGIVHVGRAEDNEVVLADVGVSRRHARIEVIAGGGLVIEDLGSGNGTWFGGHQVVRQVLGHGEQVTIDPFTLRFEVHAGVDTPDVTDGRDATVLLKPPGPEATLTVVSAHKMPVREFTLPANGVITLGRSEKNGIVLPEPASSRVHAEIVSEGSGWLLRDFGSSNGTFVNARRVKERPLEEGDRIRIGTVELRFALVHATEGTEAFDGALVSAPGARALPPPPPPPPATAAYAAPQPGPTAWPASAVSIPGDGAGFQPPPAWPLAASAPPPAWPVAAAAPPPPPRATELDLQPSRGKGKALPRAARRSSGGFLSRPINQISLGVLAITFVMVGGKIASDVLASFFRPAPEVAATVAAAPPVAAPAAAATAGSPVSPDLSGASPVADPAALSAPVPAPAPRGGSGSAGSLDAGSLDAGSLDPGATDPIMAEGMKAFAEARYFDAAGSFYRVLQIDPNHRGAKRMGYVACEFITLSEVRASLVQRTTTDAARSEAKLAALAAVSKAQAGELPVANARVVVTDALAIAPGDAELVAALATLDTKQASVVRAVSAGRVAAQTRDLDAKLATAQADLDRGAHTKAARGFEAVMAADPSRATPQYYQAEEGVRSARDRMKADSKASWSEANAAMKVGDWLTARKRLDDVVKINPYDDTAAAKLVEARKHLKEDASEIYKEARVLEDMGQTEKALALYHKVQLYVANDSDPLAQRAQTRMDGLLR